MLASFRYIVHIHKVNLFAAMVLFQGSGKCAVDLGCVEVLVTALDELQFFVHISLSSRNVSYCEFVDLP